jgi:hypothetical protein
MTDNETETSVDAPRVGNRIATLFQMTDNASVTFFRIGVGVFFSAWAWDYLASGRAFAVYVEPKVHFAYPWLDRVKPLSHNGMVLVFVAVIILGLLVAAGVWYRWSSLVLALLFTYLFLIEKTNYQNHYYLMMLLAWWLPLLKLNVNVAWDAMRNPSMKSPHVSRWVLWILRFHIALPYLFGGLAKLHGDWLAGEPMRQILASQVQLPIVGPFLDNELAVFMFVWGGLLFDLAVVPGLMLSRTRAFAYVCCVAFHCMNSVLFNIHVFPWFMIFATTLFFEPDWPRRLLGGKPLNNEHSESLSAITPSRGSKWMFAMVLLYCVFHCLWPFRHLLYPGDASWTERGHLFAWRMMLRGKTAGVRYFVIDRQADQTYHPNLRGVITVDQANRFSRDPEMIVQLAHYLADTHEAKTGYRPEVRALVLTSLNGRKPQQFVDSNVDLAAEPKFAMQRSWILPLTEPLRPSPWNVPLNEWEKHVELPPLPKVNARPPE